MIGESVVNRVAEDCKRESVIIPHRHMEVNRAQENILEHAINRHVRLHHLYHLLLKTVKVHGVIGVNVMQNVDNLEITNEYIT